MLVTMMSSGSESAHYSYRFSERSFSRVLFMMVVALAASTLNQQARGVPINYGSHIGTTVDYIDVIEDTTTGDSQPLFGAPIFSADSIDFNPVGFDATAAGAGGSDTTGASLSFMLMAHAGKAITNISFSEAGDTTLGGIGNDGTATSVVASGNITISHVDGAAITPLVRPIALTFTPSGGTYGLLSDAGGLPIFHTPWQGSLLVNVGQILTQAGVPFSFGATKVSIALVNTLTATTQTGTAAVISKKDFGGISITVNIPEPATLAMVFAMVGLVTLARRGRNG